MPEHVSKYAIQYECYYLVPLAFHHFRTGNNVDILCIEGAPLALFRRRGEIKTQIAEKREASWENCTHFSKK